jgi:GNAT superfamily N-acetyltransferase
MTPGRLRVLPVTTPALDRDFCDLPYRLYRSDPSWVPPLRTAERRRWSEAHNASLRRRWCRRLVAQRDDQVVGRVAVAIDDEFCRRWSPETGFFGSFECPEDPEAAAALLAAAKDNLRGRGMTRLLGPINLTTHDEVGLLVEGHGSRPAVLSPYNPPYYERLLLGRGLTPKCDYHAYEWLPDAKHSPAVERLLAAASSRAGLTIRPSQPRRWDEDARLLWRLYNACFDRVWGFVPLTWEEFRERADSFRPFYHPELVLFAEIRGEPAGFALVLPDVNEALAQAGGRLWPLGLLRLALAVRRLRTARFLLLGVLPAHTGAGLAALLAHQAAATARRLGIRRAELSLVHQDNDRVAHVIEAFGAARCKTYRLFEKAIRAGGR